MSPQGGAEKRFNSRFGTAFAAVHSGRNGFFVDGKMVNISRSGFCLLTEENVVVGEKLEVFLELPTGEELALQAQVIHRDRVFHLLENGQKQAWNQVGLYLTFIEAGVKPQFEALVASLTPARDHGQTPPEMGQRPPEQRPPVQPRPVQPRPVQPRIRLSLDGPERGKQLHQLQHIADRGLYIEVAQPLSVLERPRIRLVNPLTQAVCEITGGVVQTQVIATGRPGSVQAGAVYGIFVRFDDISVAERAAIHQILATLSPADHARTFSLTH